MFTKNTIGRAIRPIFTPKFSTNQVEIGVKEVQIEFDWHMGMSREVRKRSIISLHAKATQQGFEPILEASSKSDQAIGIQLSAFFLKNDEGIAVENLFQSSKVFKNGKQFLDLLNVTPKEAKTDPRLKENGDLTAFYFNQKYYPLEPKSLFYDWLYIMTLFKSNSNNDLKNQFLDSHFTSFSDIEFNPKKSFSCQARTLALAISLFKNESIDEFIQYPILCAQKYNLYNQDQPKASQGNLF